MDDVYESEMQCISIEVGLSDDRAENVDGEKLFFFFKQKTAYEV